MWMAVRFGDCHATDEMPRARVAAASILVGDGRAIWP
jgi:hypothetical protein